MRLQEVMQRGTCSLAEVQILLFIECQDDLVLSRRVEIGTRLVGQRV